MAKPKEGSKHFLAKEYLIEKTDGQLTSSAKKKQKKIKSYIKFAGLFQGTEVMNLKVDCCCMGVGGTIRRVPFSCERKVYRGK